ncbi:Fc.00g097220.m01.CDS01 [Cosmosporella sp. VM-42]
MSSTQDIQLAINRIYRALSSKRKSGYRDIRLGLDRINRVVPDTQEWQGVHVAGTNGKGSICAFLSGLFRLSGVGYGSYTSPAFPERHNGVTINGLYVNPRMYEMEMQHVQAKWNRIAAGWKFQHGEDPDTLSPFELETATAFRVFNKMRVPYGIVEVGMGGATDATNAMKQKAVTIISKIGLDHQEYLGNNIENIAKVKAGIMQKGVPCIVDHTNQPSVVRVLREHAREIGTDLIMTWKAEPFLMSLNNNKWKLESYQIQNLICAALAFRHMFPHKEINLDKLMATNPYLPGRMEQVEIAPEATGLETRKILVDGAHNMLGIEGLVGHVDKQIRKPDQPVTWIMGLSSSKHKPFDEIIEKVVRPGDNFAFVEFAPGPNDPQPAPANYGSDHAKAIVRAPEQIYGGEPDIGSALKWACEMAGQDGPIVVTGSLYLVRDLFSLDGVRRQRELGTRRPGRSQLYRYTKLSQERTLTEEESREFKQARRHWYLSPVRNQTFANVRDGGEPVPLEVSEELAEYQRKAAHHKQQEKGYRHTISTIKNDISQQSGEEAGDSVSNLVVQLEDLEKEAAKHRKLYDEAMLKVRGRPALPHKKYMGYKKIFGHSKKPKSPTQSPYLSIQEPTPDPETTPVEPEPEVSWDQSMIQQVDANARAEQLALRRQVSKDRKAEKQALKKQLEMERQAEEKAKKEAADPFQAKLASARRDS